MRAAGAALAILAGWAGCGCGGDGGGGRDLDGRLDVRFQKEANLITRLTLTPLVCQDDCLPDFPAGCGLLDCSLAGPPILAYEGIGVVFVDVPSLEEGFYEVETVLENGGIATTCLERSLEFRERAARGDQLLYEPCRGSP